MPNTSLSHSPEQTRQLAGEIAAGPEANILCLYGDLGSGKTTFVQGLAQALGIKSNIQSPTFTLVREYTIKLKSGSKNQEIKWTHLVHVDCYRIESEKDLKGVDLREYWEDKNNLVVVEWAERVKPILPKTRIDICFEQTSEKERKITVFKP